MKAKPPPVNRISAAVGALLLPAAGFAQENNPFREILSKPRFEYALENLAGEIDAAEKLAQTEMPVTGSEVVLIKPGITAAEVGVVVGSVIARIDQREIWSDAPWPNMETEQDFEFATPGGQARQFTGTTRSVGGGRVPFYRPDLAYLRREEGRDASWDRLVTLGALKWADDPALAETAWHFAVEAGYPADTFSKYFAALFGMHRPETAAASLSDFLGEFEDPTTIPALYLPGLVSMLPAGGKWGVLEKLTARHQPYFPWTPDHVSRLRDWEKARTIPGGSLLERAAARPRKDVTENLLRIRKDGSTSPFIVVPVMKIPPGSRTYQTARLEGGLKNVHLHTVFKLRTTGVHNIYANGVRFAILNRDTSGEKRSTRYPHTNLPQNIRLVHGAISTSRYLPLPRLNLTSSQLDATWNTVSPYLSTPPHPETKKRPGGGEAIVPGAKTMEAELMTMDLIRLENEVGVFLNGACYLHMPADPSIEDVTINWNVSGMWQQTEEFTVWKLE